MTRSSVPLLTPLLLLGHPLFCLASNAFPDIGSVGRSVGQSVGIKKKIIINKVIHRKSRNRRPGTPDSLLWSLETTRHGHKINMAEKLVDVILK